MKLLPLLCLLSPWFGPGSAQKSSDVVTVAEGEDALLSCSLGSKIEKFDWIKDKDMPDKRKDVFLVMDSSHDSNSQDPQFQGRVSFFKDELKAGNASIKIKRTRLEDSGNYTCVLFDRPDIHIRLNVGRIHSGVHKRLTIRSVIGAASEPLVKSLNGANTWGLLECKVKGVPKPEVEWRNSAGEVLPTKPIHVTESQDGQFHVKLQVYVTKSDNYTCVATQKNICHEINNTIYEHITGEASHIWTESYPGWIVGGIGFVLLVAGY